MVDQPIEENSNLSSLNSNLSASNSNLSSLDSTLSALVGDLAKRIYGGEEITFDSDLLHHTAKPLVDGLQKGYGKSLVEVEYNSPDYKALENLTKNAFKFSASKDFHILQDMTNALRDGDRVRSFDEFRAEVDKINVKYNQNWLRTEYNQAIAASQATARWQEFQENAKAMPFLQYQAVMDSNTRPDHQRLHGVIKRIDNPFWNTHFPPLGWGCRCEVIQLPGKNHKETPDGSFQKPDVPPQFRENFGKKQQLFSDKHPYYQNKCQGCTKTAKLATENNLQCQACLNAMEQCKEEIRKERILQPLRENNYHNNKTGFNNVRKEARLKVREQLSQYPGEKIVIKGDRILEDELYFSNTEIDRLRDHCFTELEVKAMENIFDILAIINNGEKEPMRIRSKNFKLKAKELVQYFSVYKVDFMGAKLNLKCRVCFEKGKFVEHPYSLKEIERT